MTTLTINIGIEDEPGKDSYELAKEIHSGLYNSGLKVDPTMTIGKDYIVVDLHASKHSEKTPQSALKAVSDSLDRVYSEGCKQGKSHKFCGVSCVPYERLSYLDRIRAMHELREVYEWQEIALTKCMGGLNG